jgi:hypothetical protein
MHGKLCILAITYITESYFASAHVKSNNAECQLTEGWPDNQFSAVITSPII